MKFRVSDALVGLASCNLGSLRTIAEDLVAAEGEILVTKVCRCSDSDLTASVRDGRMDQHAASCRTGLVAAILRVGPETVISAVREEVADLSEVGLSDENTQLVRDLMDSFDKRTHELALVDRVTGDVTWTGEE